MSTFIMTIYKTVIAGAIMVCVLMNVCAYTYPENVLTRPPYWKTRTEIPFRRQARPQNILTLQEFIRRRGIMNQSPERNSNEPVSEDRTELNQLESSSMEQSTSTGRYIGDEPWSPLVYEDLTKHERHYIRNDRKTEENSSLSNSSNGDAFRKHIVGDLVAGFKYMRGIFLEAVAQADEIADKYIELDEASKMVHRGERVGRKRKHKPEDSSKVAVTGYGDAERVTGYGEKGTTCQQQTSVCQSQDRADIGREATGNDEGEEEEEEDDAGDIEARAGRKLSKKKKKFLRKLLVPLLLSYKLKFFALAPVLISGLVLLVGSTGLAGFFFALFAAVISIKNVHMG